MGNSIMGKSNYSNLSDKNTVLPRCPNNYPVAAPLLLRCYPRQLQTRPNFSFPYIIVMPKKNDEKSPKIDLLEFFENFKICHLLDFFGQDVLKCLMRGQKNNQTKISSCLR